MVILFSNRKSKTELEIIEILKNHGGNYISDNKIIEKGGSFTIISEYKKTEISVKNGVAVFCNGSERFENQFLPRGIIGVCEDDNYKALEIFNKNNIAAISCGMSNKNTITLSSLNNNSLLATLQRTITDNFGKDIEPGEFKIKITKNYNPFSIMAATSALLLKGIYPTEF